MKTVRKNLTHVLSQIKVLDRRIEQKIGDINLIGIGFENPNDTAKKAMSEEAATFLSNHQAVVDMIQRRARLKEILVLTNASHQVTIGSEQMSVAAAIERKRSIVYEKLLLTEMKRQYAMAERNLNSSQAELERSLTDLRNKAVSSPQPQGPEEIQATVELKRKESARTLNDPLKLRERIVTLEAKIDEFESEVDEALSTFNAMTMVDIPE